VEAVESIQCIARIETVADYVDVRYSGITEFIEAHSEHAVVPLGESRQSIDCGTKSSSQKANLPAIEVEICELSYHKSGTPVQYTQIICTEPSPLTEKHHLSEKLDCLPNMVSPEYVQISVHDTSEPPLETVPQVGSAPIPKDRGFEEGFARLQYLMEDQREDSFIPNPEQVEGFQLRLALVSCPDETLKSETLESLQHIHSRGTNSEADVPSNYTMNDENAYSRPIRDALAAIKSLKDSIDKIMTPEFYSNFNEQRWKSLKNLFERKIDDFCKIFKAEFSSFDE
jgi:hypothetical protein